MKFQRYINQHTNQITLITAILIGVGLLGKVVDSDMVYTVSFIAASIISAVPIVLRAVSALRFKTISIELLVSIAVIGAFIIGEYNESAIVTFLFLFGTFLEDKTLAKTRHSIKDLTEMAPTTAMRRRMLTLSTLTTSSWSKPAVRFRLTGKLWMDPVTSTKPVLLVNQN